jgi:hypothetical protein
MNDPLHDYFGALREVPVPDSVRQFRPEARWQREVWLDFGSAAASVLMIVGLAAFGERWEVPVPAMDLTVWQWRQLTSELARAGVTL